MGGVDASPLQVGGGATGLTLGAGEQGSMQLLWGHQVGGRAMVGRDRVPSAGARLVPALSSPALSAAWASSRVPPAVMAALLLWPLQSPPGILPEASIRFSNKFKYIYIRTHIHTIHIYEYVYIYTHTYLKQSPCGSLGRASS